MKLLTFHGPSTDEVMANIRAIFGPDAILVAERKDARTGEIEILAASPPNGQSSPDLSDPELCARLSHWAEGFAPTAPALGSASNAGLKLSMAAAPASFRQAAAKCESQAASALFDAGFSADFATRLANAMPLSAPDYLFTASGGPAPPVIAPTYSLESLAHALSEQASFAPLSKIPDRPVLLAGPPGSGKSLTIVKLAARALAAGALPRIVIADPLELGPGAPVTMFAGIAPVEIEVVRTPDALKTLLETPTQSPIFIDSWSVNPLEQGEISALAAIGSVARSCNSLNIGVMPAGLAPHDAGDITRVFSLLGFDYVILTRCDATRMPGAAIESVVTEGLSFSELGTSSRPTPGLAPASPVTLARLFPGLDTITPAEQPGEKIA